MLARVSVIIPTYNRRSVIDRAIGSVFNQSFGDWELLVVDDGSTDGTWEHLQQYEDQRVRLFRTENKGVSAARNLGIQKARGPWVAFLDSDDQWLAAKLEKQMVEAQKNPECPLIHGNEIWIRNGVRVNPMKKHEKKGGDVFSQALKLCCISPSAAMIKKSLLDELGGFREDFPVCEDYDLWLRITSRYLVGYVGDFIVKKYGGNRDQLSRRYKAMDYWRVLAISNCICCAHLSPEKCKQARGELHHKAGILLKAYRKHENLENFDRVFSLLGPPGFVEDKNGHGSIAALNRGATDRTIGLIDPYC